MLRAETKARARALQMLYAWELTGNLPIAETATRLARLTGPDPLVFDRAEALATGVVAAAESLDRETEAAADNWRLSRIGTVERNILRLATYELRLGEEPPKVVINEAVQLAHWFAGAKAPAFINGVLDRIAHSLGRL
ncbi:MAG TPA: transcription antitermination factor NusB [Gemmatimonadales bacterium]|nr:transcription antitermination factor NusB [Gemmatimonadales bacterium]